jgi:hypothetical protein
MCLEQVDSIRVIGHLGLPTSNAARTAAKEPEMEERWISELSARALNWGAWAVVVLSVFGSVI